MRKSQDAEIIVAGSGLAGTTVLRHLLSHPSTKEKEILILDRNHEPQNDKTWCFWSDEDPFTEALVTHRWKWITVADTSGVYKFKLDLHTYKCIRSGDYLRACNRVIDASTNVRRMTTDVLGFSADGTKPVVQTSDGDLCSTLVLQSIIKPKPIVQQRASIVLLQHFLGWEIETSHDVFDSEVATFMDFRTDQRHGFAFVYVLPYSKRHALIEYTLFTPSTLHITEYETALRTYIGDVLEMSPSSWQVSRTEYGIIPMEDTKFSAWYAHGVLNMGMNGGQSKPSTGFTFSRVQMYALEVAKSIAKRSMQDLHQQSKGRFLFYDRLILWLLREQPQVVPGIFIRLFKKNGADKIFRFLNERTHFGQELSIMASTKWRHFFKAIWYSIVRK